RRRDREDRPAVDRDLLEAITDGSRPQLPLRPRLQAVNLERARRRGGEGRVRVAIRRLPRGGAASPPRDSCESAQSRTASFGGPPATCATPPVERPDGTC